jgi:hypothetical protein
MPYKNIEDRKRQSKLYHSNHKIERNTSNLLRQKKNKVQIEANRRGKRDEERLAVFALLGGKCLHCGFNDHRALQIDHIHGNGSKDSNRKHYRDYYSKLLKLSDINKTYQLLCANCNWIKRIENNEISGVKPPSITYVSTI